MKKLLFCAMILGLAGCNASIGDSISASNIVWVNQSDHIIRLVASVGGYAEAWMKHYKREIHVVIINLMS